jgi:hypothetical protein
MYKYNLWIKFSVTLLKTICTKILPGFLNVKRTFQASTKLFISIQKDKLMSILNRVSEFGGRSLKPLVHQQYVHVVITG